MHDRCQDEKRGVLPAAVGICKQPSRAEVDVQCAEQDRQQRQRNDARRHTGQEQHAASEFGAGHEVGAETREALRFEKRDGARQREYQDLQEPVRDEHDAETEPQ